MGFSESLDAFEASIAALERRTSGEDLQGNARRSLAQALRVVLGLGADDTSSIPQLFETATRSQNGRREAALLCVRALSVPNLLPESDALNQLDRRMVDLVEVAAPDICSRFITDNKEQNFRKVERLRGVHNAVCAELKMFSGVSPSPEIFMASRPGILKAAGHKLAKSYLSIYDYATVTASVDAIIENMIRLRDTKDHTFGERLTSLRTLIDDQLAAAEASPTFLARDFLQPFLRTARVALARLDGDCRGRFSCTLGPRSGDTVTVEKRYPLLRQGVIVTASIPLLNSGPGVAVAVVARVDAPESEILLGSSHLAIGDIPPGPFALSIQFIVGRPAREIRFNIDLTWEVVGSPERRSYALSATLTAQAADIDWTTLQKREPYAMTVAAGKEFYGRKEKVAVLTSRLLKDRMQSSYITGQKRVGKSSLALAVRDEVAKSAPDENIKFHYLEYGEYANVDPTETLAALGENLYQFLSEHLDEAPSTPPGFVGTLAPLMRIADKLRRVQPAARFVIILDEFDEIPQELYRIGALAETFFANLRTLSGKSNVAFMLVGGENMPFIVSAQGDRLNKFARESLNFFSRTDEWNDFIDLVRSPTEGTVRWHDSAVSEIFNLTNGHPYYAKLLCARVYATAVTEKDADVTVDEVHRAYNHLVSMLDINSFSHLWRDGIQGTREEVEMIALQRCRVLVAIARTIRSGESLSMTNISAHRSVTGLPEHLISPILEDLCRRGILEDDGGAFRFSVPLFRDWLAQSGINKLISDTLGDQLTVASQAAEEKLYVSDGEISEALRRWPPYRGHLTTTADVRAWLAQVKKYSQQRLLFNLLTHLRFFTEIEIREKLRLAHRLVLGSVPEYVRRSMSDRRKDILVTYVDGPAKSGSYYASRYAEENLIAADSVVEMNAFGATLEKHEQDFNTVVNGVVIVDDILGTGRTLAGNIQQFLRANGSRLKVRNAAVVIVALAATKNGEDHLRHALAEFRELRVDVRVCEPIDSSNIAFDQAPGIWSSVSDAAEAKALCVELGTKVAKSTPLGYGDQGLLVVFPTTCPNNSLPILHSGSTSGWRPLFERPKN